MFSNWTVNVFCFCAFLEWNKNPLVTWNPAKWPDLTVWISCFEFIPEESSWCATPVPRSGWMSSGTTLWGRVQYPATFCSCSCYCTCGGSSLMHWCTWSLDACSPIKVNVIKPLARLSMWPTFLEDGPSARRRDHRKAAKIRLRWERDFVPRSVTSDQMWWSWWCSICRIKRALENERRRTHHSPSHRPGMQIGGGELWISSVTLVVIATGSVSRGAAVLNFKPS